MKTFYISDLKTCLDEARVELFGHVRAARSHGQVLFLDLVDSTGQVQVVFQRTRNDANKVPTKESAISVIGHYKKDRHEIEAQEIVTLNRAIKAISPSPRDDFDVFDSKYTDLVLRNKHLYLRNDRLMAIQVFRGELLHLVRKWFYEHRFLEIAAPVITPTTLYEERTAIPLHLGNQNLFLSQCAGYYLEAACVAHERVYNISPSFRGEEGRSKRHLTEYWHIKAEMTFCSHEEMIGLVEDLLGYLSRDLMARPYIDQLCKTIGTTPLFPCIEVPFPRLSYSEAIAILRAKGHEVDEEESISTADEELLSREIGSSFWLCGKPRSIEPFPYRLSTTDSSRTMVADLIAGGGYGEILGTAEKIYQADELDERMLEKNRIEDTRLHWVREVHEFGCPPHSAFGAGVERLIRWFLGIEHVRDAHPFPRSFGRQVTV